MKTYLLLFIVTLSFLNIDAQLIIDDSRLRTIINKNLNLYEKEKTFPTVKSCLKRTFKEFILDSGKALEKDYESLVNGTLILVRAYKSRVLPDWQLSIGMAVPVGKNRVLTNFHMVDPKKRGDVFMLMDFEGNCFPVLKVRKSSKENDLAVLECDAQSLNALKLSEENETGT